MMRLGKKPARAGAVPHKFSAFFSAPDLPTPPLVFGLPGLISQWGLLANDMHSDCVWADFAHQVMYWNAIAKRPIPKFRDQDVLSDYSAQTGYDQTRPETDQGTDMGEASKYWRDTGIVDANGTRHKVDISVSLRVGDLDELMLATYLFGCVSLGVDLPSNAEDQFTQAIPWSIESGITSVGGHDITIVGRNSRGNILGVSWGRLQAITPNWVADRMDEGVLHLSTEFFRDNDKLSPRGYDRTALLAAIDKL